MNETDINRFWSLVDKTGDCWIWIGAKNGYAGYGAFYIDGERWRAHRLAYFLTYGIRLPPKILVCHKCDNPPCVRPDHLFAGSYSDNLQDSIKKGRRNQHGLRGEENPQASTTFLIAEYIRQKVYLEGGMSYRVLAKELGLSKSVVADIAQGISYYPRVE